MRSLLPDAATQTRLSASLRDQLAPWLSARPERLIAAFAPLPGEPDLLALVDRLPDFRWALPRVEGEHLHFHRYTSLADLHPGAFGIAEPAPDRETLPIEGIGLFLCPGLAFSPAGVRLGRGKGFYDRALAKADPQAIRVGVCFPTQLLPDLPAEPHDLPMHFIATPDGVESCPSAESR